MSQRLAFQPTPACKVVLFCLLLVPLCGASDWQYEGTHTDAREFVSGGNMHVRFSVGDLHIRRGDSSKIRLQYTVKSRRESNVKDARVDFNVSGNDATVVFHAPSSGNTQFDVLVGPLGRLSPGGFPQLRHLAFEIVGSGRGSAQRADQPHDGDPGN